MPVQIACPGCGTLNPPFPVEAWGWRRYVEQSWTINAARKSLDAMALSELSEKD